MSCYAGSIALNTIGINPILAMVLYQGGRISFKSLDNIFNIKSNIKTKFDLKKAEFICRGNTVTKEITYDIKDKSLDKEGYYTITIDLGDVTYAGAVIY